MQVHLWRHVHKKPEWAYMQQVSDHISFELRLTDNKYEKVWVLEPLGNEEKSGEKVLAFHNLSCKIMRLHTSLLMFR